MQGMHFIQVQQVKERGQIGFKAISRGIIEERLSEEEWAVRITGQPPVTYVRVLKTSQLRDFALFDSEEDLIAFGQTQWPTLFPKPAEAKKEETPPPAPPAPPAPAPAPAAPAPLDEDGTSTAVDYDNDCAP